MMRIRPFLLFSVMFLLTVQATAQLSGDLLEQIRAGTNKPPLLEKMLDGPMAIADLIRNIEAGQKMQGLKGVMNLTLASLSSKIHVVVSPNDEKIWKRCV